MARIRVLVYEDRRGWRYYWREGDAFAYMLRANMSGDLTMDCFELAERDVAPQGSVGCRWTPDLFDEQRVRLVAVYEKGHLRRTTSWL